MTALADLSPRQADVLDAILSHQERYQSSLTIREICDMLGIASTNGAADHIKALERKGYVTRTVGSKRDAIERRVG
ncbi:MAG: MarR family transcriptional regulator [Planctomycetota bacterium]